MGELRYYAVRRNGRTPIQSPCPTCKAKIGKKCWDLRSPMGTVLRPIHAHPKRGSVAEVDTKLPPYQVKFRDAKFARHAKGSAELTDFNIRILLLICEGLTNTAIAHQIGTEVRSVGQYVQDVLWRLGAKHKTHAVHLAYQLGILNVTDDESEGNWIDHRIKYNLSLDRKARVRVGTDHDPEGSVPPYREALPPRGRYRRTNAKRVGDDRTPQ